jgi:membrane protein DedA with SNARE-associated domain
MDAMISAIASAVAEHPGLATFIAFAASVIEAVAVLGLIIPGTPILMAVAGAAGLAGLPMTPILVAAVLGAIIGDGVSFWLGYRYGCRIRIIWPFASRPALIGQAEAFLQRFGAPSVALARFVPVLRSTVPLVAGIAGMPVRRFLTANVLSALVWAPAHVFPAQLAALLVEDIQAGQWQAAAAIAAALSLTVVAVCAMHRLGRRKLLEGPGQP